MTTHDSIRHLLKQTLSELGQRSDAGEASDPERQTLNEFERDVRGLLAKLENDNGNGIDSKALSEQLFALHRRCVGPLKPYRGLIEDTLAGARTMTLDQAEALRRETEG